MTYGPGRNSKRWWVRRRGPSRNQASIFDKRYANPFYMYRSYRGLYSGYYSGLVTRTFYSGSSFGCSGSGFLRSSYSPYSVNRTNATYNFRTVWTNAQRNANRANRRKRRKRTRK